MLIKKLNCIKNLENVKISSPLIHCITNPISINDCANGVLAVGARPIMAEHPDEVSQITKTAKALALNLGNITDARMVSMLISAETAVEIGIPFVIDTVGVACSSLRLKYARNIIKKSRPTVIKGNITEIKMFSGSNYSQNGVDSLKSDSLDLSENSYLVLETAKKLGCIVLASGEIDIISDGTKVVHVYNGTKQLSNITGTGCLLNVLVASFLSVSPDIYGAITASVVMGICGEMSVTTKGSGTFKVNLMDALSKLTEEQFLKYFNAKEVNINGL
ncbi:MAG: hydroxyethylthiazole kinase [Clostridiales bacterium]|nr:hydroxyethylthiazole kinase [Clostridiales bacterium]